MLQSVNKTFSSPVHSISSQSGYTLFLVLELITILAIMFTVMLRDIQMVRIQAIREVHRTQARILAESGVEKAEYFLNGNQGKDIFWEGREPADSFPPFGSITLENRRFGLYSLLTSTGQRVRTTCVVKAFAGRTLPQECLPVLTLHGKVGGLALMPGSSIKGTVVLSHGRICQGRSSQEVKDKDLKVEIGEAGPLPFDSSQIITSMERLERAWSAACSSGMDPEKRRTAAGIDSIAVRDTIVVMGDVSLNRGSFTGKTIFASGKITVSGNAVLLLCQFSGSSIELNGGYSEKCLFYSKKPLLISGGSHNSQCLCRDSIVVGSKSTLRPLTVLLLRREGREDSTAAIYISPNTMLNGTIICSADSSARTYARVPSIVFGKGCTLSGICMTDGDVDINGSSITGHLWTRSIVTSDVKMAYTNFLIDTKLREPQVDGVFPLLGGIPVRVLVDPVETTFSVKKRKPLTENTKDTEKKNLKSL
jgi:hypothetical protein